MNQIVGQKSDGSMFLMLVLEPGNLHKLQQGQPISMRIQDLFPRGIPKKLELEIFYSETPVADARELSKIAEVSLDERTPKIGKTRPHCPECKSSIEQLGMMKYEHGPVDVLFCSICGCVLSFVPKDRQSG